MLRKTIRSSKGDSWQNQPKNHRTLGQSRTPTEPALANVDQNNEKTEETMESLALTHSFTAYESPEELQLKSLDELGLKIPNSAWVGLVGVAVALSVVSVPGEAQASCHYKRCGQKSYHSYAEVVTNGGRLNIRKHPSRCSHVIGKLYDGDHVKLTGHYKNGWAQLKGGGWVSASWLY
jgi:uncharacterized protein YgiM (DUF1202 family)